MVTAKEDRVQGDQMQKTCKHMWNLGSKEVKACGVGGRGRVVGVTVLSIRWLQCKSDSEEPVGGGLREVQKEGKCE